MEGPKSASEKRKGNPIDRNERGRSRSRKRPQIQYAMTNLDSSLLGALASANARRVKRDTPLRADPHCLARVACSRAELSEWLARHPEEPSQWFAKEDLSQ